MRFALFAFLVLSGASASATPKGGPERSCQCGARKVWCITSTSGHHEDCDSCCARYEAWLRGQSTNRLKAPRLKEFPRGKFRPK